LYPFQHRASTDRRREKRLRWTNYTITGATWLQNPLLPRVVDALDVDGRRVRIVRTRHAAGAHQGRIGRRPPRRPHRRTRPEVVHSPASGDSPDDHQGRKTAADAARLFKVHPVTVSRRLPMSHNVDDATPGNVQSDNGILWRTSFNCNRFTVD